MLQGISCKLFSWKVLGLFAAMLLSSAGVSETVAGEPSVDSRHGRLKVSENKRFLVHEDGTPFFYLGDTAPRGSCSTVSTARRRTSTSRTGRPRVSR